MQWAAYQTKHPGDGKDKFVQNLDPATKTYLSFVTKNILMKDCWSSLKYLASSFKTLRSEYPTLVSTMGEVLIALADPQSLATKDGVDTTQLTPMALNRLTAGALYKRYEQERVVGLFRKLKENVAGLDTSVRLSQLDDLLSNPSITPGLVSELCIVRTCLGSVLPKSEKLDYVLADLDVRTRVLTEWAPQHELAFLRNTVDGCVWLRAP